MLSREPQCANICSIVSTIPDPWQEGAKQALLPEGDQWLHSAWVLYRPEIIKHCTLLILTLYGEAPADEMIVWDLIRLMNCGWKYVSESRDSDYCRSFCPQ